MEPKTLASSGKKKKKKRQRMIIHTPTQTETTIQNRERERQDGSLSSGEAAELPDSTYRGNILTRSFFRR